METDREVTGVRVRLSAMVPKHDVDAIARIAEANDRSIAAQLRIAVRDNIRKENGNGND